MRTLSSGELKIKHKTQQAKIKAMRVDYNVRRKRLHYTLNIYWTRGGNQLDLYVTLLTIYPWISLLVISLEGTLKPLEFCMFLYKKDFLKNKQMLLTHDILYTKYLKFYIVIQEF